MLRDQNVIIGIGVKATVFMTRKALVNRFYDGTAPVNQSVGMSRPMPRLRACSITA